jgi:hypothetical protein
MRGPLGAGQPKRYIVAQVVGALLAFTVALFATGIGLDRDRAFYPAVTIVIASYYALFAVMGSSTRTRSRVARRHSLSGHRGIGLQVIALVSCGCTRGTRSRRS